MSAGQLQPDVRRTTRRACAFVIPGEPRIYVARWCPAYQRAERDRLEAMKLAALIRHELAHLEGAGEHEARMVELHTFRTLLRTAPAELQTPGMMYAAELQRHARRSLGEHEPNTGRSSP